MNISLVSESSKGSVSFTKNYLLGKFTLQSFQA